MAFVVAVVVADVVAAAGVVAAAVVLLNSLPHLQIVVGVLRISDNCYPDSQ